MFIIYSSLDSLPAIMVSIVEQEVRYVKNFQSSYVIIRIL